MVTTACPPQGQHALDLVQVWSPVDPALPRSPLYHLAPIGSGTPLVESLTSYVGRLADAHAVPILTLIKHVLFPRMRVHRTVYKLTEWAHLSLGTSSTAQAWVTTVEAQTGQRDLQWLTLLPWASLINSHGLLRTTKVWCAYCYRDWRSNGHPIYDPLLWSMAAVTTCPQHQRSLQHRCLNPDCQKVQPLLSPRFRVDHCAYCCQWLGDEGSSSPQATAPSTSSDHANQSWITEAIGEMLSGKGVRPGRTLQDQFQSTLRSCLARHAGGKMRRLGRMLGVCEETVPRWLRVRSTLSLKQLLSVAYHFNTTPVQFLTSTPEQIAEYQLPLPTIRGPLFQKPARKTLFSLDPAKNRIARCLLNDTSADPPLTMREISRHLGIAVSTLRTCFPDACQATSRRCEEWRRTQTIANALRLQTRIREAVQLLRARGMNPKPYLVAKSLKMPFFSLWPTFKAAWDAVAQEDS